MIAYLRTLEEMSNKMFLPERVILRNAASMQTIIDN
jgi:hypothetical protein